MKFELITQKQYQEYWEIFTQEYPAQYTFLQSPIFGKFREKIGEKIIYTALIDKQGQVRTAHLVQVIKSGWKKWLHIPHAQIKTLENLDVYTNGLKKIGKDYNCDLIRIAPLVEENPFRSPFKKGEVLKQLQDIGFNNAAVHLVNPEKTWILDITKTEDEIMAQMHKKHRSDLRRGIKKGVDVIHGNDKKNLEIFWDLHMETVKRHGFMPFSKKSTKIELEVFGKNCQIFNGGLPNSEKKPSQSPCTKGEDIEYFSSAIILFDQDQAYYHQGASLHSKIPVSNVVLWEAIKEAKLRGCKVFNFWGVSDKNNKKHPWTGLSNFKRKFGGKEIDYLHCQDYPLTYKYYFNFILEKYRRWKRGY